MTDVRISDLSAVSSVVGTNEFEVNEGGTSKKSTAAQIAAYVASTISSPWLEVTGNVRLTTLSGNVSIGIEGSKSNLHVNGNVFSLVGYATPGNLVVSSGTFTSAGKLGIATLAPEANLHVVGNIFASANIYASGNLVSAGPGLHSFGNTASATLQLGRRIFVNDTNYISINEPIQSSYSLNEYNQLRIYGGNSTNDWWGIAPPAAIMQNIILGGNVRSSNAAAAWVGVDIVPTVSVSGSYANAVTILRVSPWSNSNTTISAYSLFDVGINRSILGQGDHHTYFKVSNIGRVGINTATPIANLHVTGNIFSTASVEATSFKQGSTTLFDGSANLSNARYNSGTSASYLTYLRGDGVWSTLTRAYHDAPISTQTDKGSVGSGTVTFDTSVSSKQKLTVTGSLTIAFSNWPASGTYGECEIQLVNGGLGTITFPTINWFVGDGRTSTTFSAMSVTLASSGTNTLVVWTQDGGTTLYGKAM